MKNTSSTAFLLVAIPVALLAVASTHAFGSTPSAVSITHPEVVTLKNVQPSSAEVKILDAAEGQLYSRYRGYLQVQCNGKNVKVSSAKPLYLVNSLMVKDCKKDLQVSLIADKPRNGD